MSSKWHVGIVAAATVILASGLGLLYFSNAKTRSVRGRSPSPGRRRASSSLFRTPIHEDNSSDDEQIVTVVQHSHPSASSSHDVSSSQQHSQNVGEQTPVESDPGPIMDIHAALRMRNSPADGNELQQSTDAAESLAKTDADAPEEPDSHDTNVFERSAIFVEHPSGDDDDEHPHSTVTADFVQPNHDSHDEGEGQYGDDSDTGAVLFKSTASMVVIGDQPDDFDHHDHDIDVHDDDKRVTHAASKLVTVAKNLSTHHHSSPADDAVQEDQENLENQEEEEPLEDNHQQEDHEESLEQETLQEVETPQNDDSAEASADTKPADNNNHVGDAHQDDEVADSVSHDEAEHNAHDTLDVHDESDQEDAHAGDDQNDDILSNLVADDQAASLDDKEDRPVLSQVTEAVDADAAVDNAETGIDIEPLTVDELDESPQTEDHTEEEQFHSPAELPLSAQHDVHAALPDEGSVVSEDLEASHDAVTQSSTELVASSESSLLDSSIVLVDLTSSMMSIPSSVNAPDVDDVDGSTQHEHEEDAVENPPAELAADVSLATEQEQSVVDESSVVEIIEEDEEPAATVSEEQQPAVLSEDHPAVVVVENEDQSVVAPEELPATINESVAEVDQADSAPVVVVADEDEHTADSIPSQDEAQQQDSQSVEHNEPNPSESSQASSEQLPPQTPSKSESRNHSGKGSAKKNSRKKGRR